MRTLDLDVFYHIEERDELKDKIDGDRNRQKEIYIHEIQIERRID